VNQFRGADLIAERWDISREDMEAFALGATAAPPEPSTGRFSAEIVAFEGVEHDEGVRRDTKPRAHGPAADAP